MGTYEITVNPYSGTLTDLNLGGLIDQTVLSAIGSSVGAEIRNNNGVLGRADSGTALFSLEDSDVRAPLSYVGTGTISLLGIGSTAVFSTDITIFKVGRQIYLYLPDGLPPQSGLHFRIDINADEPLLLPDFIPCFASGTRIVTRRGAMAVEFITPGEIVIGSDGRQHEVLWVGSKTIDLAALCDAQYAKLVPIRIKATAMGGNQPYSDLVVSQQHRILLRHPLTEAMFGVADCFAPARSMVGYMAEFATDITRVTYHHILCAEHVALLANGMEAESLFLGDLMRDGMRPALRDEIAAIFPDILSDTPIARVTCQPTLKSYEARLLANIIAGPAKCSAVPKRPKPVETSMYELQHLLHHAPHCHAGAKHPVVPRHVPMRERPRLRVIQ